MLPKFSLPASSVAKNQLAPDVTSQLPTAIDSVATDYAWCIVDANDKVAIGVNRAGRFLVGGVDITTMLSGNLQGQITANAAYLIPSPNIACWGDSLTFGQGGTAYPTQLSALLGGARAVFNGGRGGDSSTQIAFRQAGNTVLLQVAGNKIPASGSVVVTPVDVNIIQAVTGQIAYTLTGTLFGIAGTLARQPDGSYTFTRTTAGTATVVDKNVVFIPDTNGHDFETVVIWAGNNNFADQPTILTDVANMVALLKPSQKRFVIMGLTNANVRPAGSADYAKIIAVNQALRAAYPRNYLDIREALVRSYNPNDAQDVTDFNNDVPPSSIRVDAIHLNTAGYAIVAQAVKNFLTSKNW